MLQSLPFKGMANVLNSRNLSMRFSKSKNEPVIIVHRKNFCISTDLETCSIQVHSQINVRELISVATRKTLVLEFDLMKQLGALYFPVKPRFLL